MKESELNMNVIEFYEEYCNSLANLDLKKKYLESLLIDNKVFKFIPFTDDQNLNERKVFCIKNKKIWLSCIYTFKDRSELLMKVNYEKASKILGKTRSELKFFVDTIRELNDISCFTVSIREEMWEKYANNHNGICLEFNIRNNELLFPIIYLDKDAFDYTDLLIDFYKTPKMVKGTLLSPAQLKFEIYSSVLKDKTDYGFEEEIRLVSGDCYDNPNDELESIIMPGRKKQADYKGRYISYTKIGLELTHIYFGKKLDINIKNELNQLNIVPTSDE